MSVEKLFAVKGMNDILPEHMPYWHWLESCAKEVLASYGYREIRTPIVEASALFSRGLGQVTDIVEKEMYAFTDKLNGDELSLRPENTAGVVRAVIEHNLTYQEPQRLWYRGPMFRHERPQRGRYRQFHQIGVESLGFSGPDIDAELILLSARLWQKLGLSNVSLELNSIGDAPERAAHRQALIDYLKEQEFLLDEDAKRRLHTNPLRILDSKNPAMQEMLGAAPRLIDFLEHASRAHFDGVQALLQANNISFTVNPRLVRGMDYYNRTVFEWISTDLGAQATICGGGRYDPLTPLYGGNETPACGFALGMERVIELLKQIASAPLDNPDIYLMHTGGACGLLAMQLAEELRTHQMSVVLHCMGSVGIGSFKSQMKRADNSGAQLALILGEDEIAQNAVTIKWLRAREKAQEKINRVELIQYLQTHYLQLLSQ